MLLVFGSINADLLFNVERLPAPGETVLCATYTLAPGGKGANQATAAARYGAPVRFAGRVGPDGFGDTLRQDLEAEGVDTALLLESSRPTGTAVVAVDGRGENAIIVASGANLDVTADQVPDDVLDPTTTVLAQNEVPLTETVALFARAKTRGARTLLNLAPASALPAGLLGVLDLLVVNELEARALTRASGTPEELAARLRQHCGSACVITLGSAGAIADSDAGRFAVPALPVQVVDTTGAGDTFVGVMAAALDAGLPLADALARASVAGALACRAVGARAAQPSAAEIRARLAELGPVRAI